MDSRLFLSCCRLAEEPELLCSQMSCASACSGLLEFVLALLG